MTVRAFVWLIVLQLAACGGKRMTYRDHIAAQKNASESKSGDLHVETLEHTELRGVVMTSDMVPLPVTFVGIALVNTKTGRQLEVTTDHQGRFTFVGDIPNGSYEVRVTGEYKGTYAVHIHGHSNDDVVVTATKRASDPL
jgi:hypothetical protein